MCVPDKTLIGGIKSVNGLNSPFPVQTYTPPAPASNTFAPQLQQQAGFQPVIAPQLGAPAAPPLFAPRIERAQATSTQYTTDANGVKKPAKTGYQSLQINRQP